MVREIKFRAWVVNNATSEMVYANDTQINSAIAKALQYQLGYEDAYPDKNNIEDWQKDIKFMQFTGLTDKNCNMLYESDIVECGYGKGKIVFKSGCFMVEWIDDKEAYLEFLFSRKGMYTRKDDEQFELIGNIYENPELLNK